MRLLTLKFSALALVFGLSAFVSAPASALPKFSSPVASVTESGAQFEQVRMMHHKMRHHKMHRKMHRMHKKM